MLKATCRQYCSVFFRYMPKMHSVQCYYLMWKAQRRCTMSCCRFCFPKLWRAPPSPPLFPPLFLVQIQHYQQHAIQSAGELPASSLKYQTEFRLQICEMMLNVSLGIKMLMCSCIIEICLLKGIYLHNNTFANTYEFPVSWQWKRKIIMHVDKEKLQDDFKLENCLLHNLSQLKNMKAANACLWK